MPKKLFNQGGFTLIELLISIAILLIVTTLVIFSLRTFGRQVEIDSVGQDILSTLRLARSKTLASEGETTYGVHFESGKYVLFSGSSYTAGAAGNKEYNLSESEINSITLTGGGSEVIFDRIRGTTSYDGTVSVRLTSDTSQARTIIINPSGQVSLSQTVTTSDTRTKDSRHLHFVLQSWSIYNSTTLTLNYPNDSVTQNVTMASYFNAGKTEFDWSGTIAVGGSDQVLRIHTHSLTVSATTLSIDRDLRYNNKALTVSIDGKQIVSYTAGGTATVGAYGGSMTVQ